MKHLINIFLVFFFSLPVLAGPGYPKLYVFDYESTQQTKINLKVKINELIPYDWKYYRLRSAYHYEINVKKYGLNENSRVQVVFVNKKTSGFAPVPRGSDETVIIKDLTWNGSAFVYKSDNIITYNRKESLWVTAGGATYLTFFSVVINDDWQRTINRGYYRESTKFTVPLLEVRPLTSAMTIER